MLKKCDACGAELNEGTNFCTGCGKKVGEVSSDKDVPMINSVSDLKQINVNKSLLMKIGGVVAACLVVFFIFMNFSGRLGNDSLITIKVDDMAKSYIRDQSSAENKYKNKEMRITGTLMHKTQFDDSQNYALYIYGQSVAGKVYKIILSVPPENVSMVNKVNKGDFVNAEGVCVGIVEQEDPTDIVIQINAKKIN